MKCTWYCLLFLSSTAFAGVLIVLQESSRAVAKQDGLTPPGQVGPEEVGPGASLELELAATAPSRRSTPGLTGHSSRLADREAQPASSKAPRKPPTIEEMREFREYVGTTITDMRKQEAVPRLSNLLGRVEKMGETIESMENWLGLTHTQSDRMKSLLLSQLDLEIEYLKKWEQGADNDLLAELKASDRVARDQELSEFLSATQLRRFLAQ